MTDTSPTANRQLTEDGRSQSIYGQSGYQLGRFDQRIADLEETRAWLCRFHDEAMVAGYDARVRQLDQLEADLLEVEKARACYLADPDGSISESALYRPAADVHGGEVAFETGVPTVGGGQSLAAQSPGPRQPGGVVRTPRAPDSTHPAYRSQGPISALRPRI